MKQISVKLGSNWINIPKLVNYQVTPEPLWGDDAGRENREGEYSGTFIGYFSNLNFNIAPTTQAEFTQLCSLFQRPFFQVKFIREDTGELTTENFYGTALKAKKDLYKGKYNAFSFDIVATKRRE